MGLLDVYASIFLLMKSAFQLSLVLSWWYPSVPKLESAKLPLRIEEVTLCSFMALHGEKGGASD
jgi:hypothetical protein